MRAHVKRFALKDVRRAYDSLRTGQLTGRAVVVP
jgi:D-arabinose 1-dehydrogenase-like Zn-dependent alcohol dehydrogenase